MAVAPPNQAEQRFLDAVEFTAKASYLGSWQNNGVQINLTRSYQGGEVFRESDELLRVDIGNSRSPNCTIIKNKSGRFVIKYPKAAKLNFKDSQLEELLKTVSYCWQLPFYYTQKTGKYNFSFAGTKSYNGLPCNLIKAELAESIASDCPAQIMLWVAKEKPFICAVKCYDTQGKQTALFENGITQLTDNVETGLFMLPDGVRIKSVNDDDELIAYLGTPWEMGVFERFFQAMSRLFWNHIESISFFMGILSLIMVGIIIWLKFFRKKQKISKI